MKELKQKAAGELAFANARVKMYEDDGAVVPDVWKRLATLATSVINVPDAAPSAPADDAQAKADALTVMSVRGLVGAVQNEGTLEAVRRAIGTSKIEACRAIRDSIVVLSGVADHLGDAAGVFPEVPDVRPKVPITPAGSSSANVAPAPAGSVQASIPGAGDGPVKTKFVDWNPDAKMIAELTAKLQKAMAEVKVTVTVDVPSLIAKFKVERASGEHAKPELPFYTWAARTLKGK